MLQREGIEIEQIRAAKTHVIHPPELPDAPLNLTGHERDGLRTEAVVGIMGRHCFTSKEFFFILHENCQRFHCFFAKLFRALEKKL
jgi:hypothetical protein